MRLWYSLCNKSYSKYTVATRKDSLTDAMKGGPEARIFIELSRTRANCRVGIITQDDISAHLPALDSGEGIL